ncbi:hypothetical protein PTTG_02954 [Puccinia triticina 1-1 BBBD Race 1]|uniref:RING-type E3 ubiquitin transferase n=2 Tax=Puccinia triticina TaxID=208348 RepID=A0A0C4EQ96_PUCT1|nr:uncharacterized protein PtA15_12A496 [Puccinia triticina]OAV87733.1 hypothetical protein PTTG_02954 [Puccinia triticina 1-1 BBBD Race 1]WAQ90506.1 hypothetical protein PtA15_12A496 [Puccinia triticina]WAR61824.1 hypothetical protein PtB15_12B516 [Puccinia triticina]
MNNQPSPSDVTESISGEVPGGPSAVRGSPISLTQESPAHNVDRAEAAAAPGPSRARADPHLTAIPVDIEAAFRNVIREPDEPTVGRIVYTIDENMNATAHIETEEDVALYRQNLERQARAQAAAQPAPIVLPDFGNLDPIQEVLENMTPEQQVIIRGFFTNMNNAFRELAVSPHRPPLTAEEINQNFGDVQAFDDTMEALDQFDRARVEEFLSDLQQALIELNYHPERTAERIRHVEDLLNRIQAALPPANPGDDSSECPICFTSYHPGDRNVILPCHPSHHFHRRCIQNWLLENNNCPLCRTEVTFPR